ncbi:hypothetical protein BU15DRAFT_35501, partial [Melanogaster broomeanus]
LIHAGDCSAQAFDELLADHFMQGLLTHMKGAGQSVWPYEDYDDAFGEGSFNLSDSMIWGSREGKERFELALADRLFDHR